MFISTFWAAVFLQSQMNLLKHKEQTEPIWYITFPTYSLMTWQIIAILLNAEKLKRHQNS